MAWLRWQKRCRLVLTERSPREYLAGRPDVLGVLQSRELIEVEIKRSISDLRANRNKEHVLHRASRLNEWPRLFYYLVPRELEDRAAGCVESWAGLMIGPGPQEPQAVRIAKSAPINKESKRLTTKECVKLVQIVMNQCRSHADHVRRLKERLELAHWWGAEVKGDGEGI